MPGDAHDHEFADGGSMPPVERGEGIERLLDRAEAALALANEPALDEIGAARPYTLFELATSASAGDGEATTTPAQSISLRIEFGRAWLPAGGSDTLRTGAVLPLDRRVHDPVDVYANGALIARGEILVMNDTFCLRVTELMRASGMANVA